MIIDEDTFEERQRKSQEEIGLRWYTEKVWYPGCFGFPKQSKTTTLQYFDGENGWKTLPTEYKSIFVD